VEDGLVYLYLDRAEALHAAEIVDAVHAEDFSTYTGAPSEARARRAVTNDTLGDGARSVMFGSLSTLGRGLLCNRAW
jgi:hypothetical protein